MPPIGTTNQLKLLSQGAAQNNGQPISTDPYGLNWKNPAPNPSSTSIDTSSYDARILALQNQLQQMSQPTILPFNYGAAQATAKSQAEGQVNPVYTQQWNDYLNNALSQENFQKANTETANKLLQQNLQNTITGNATTGERTAQDVQNNVNQINNASDNYQYDTGVGFDQARTALSGSVANAGLTQSGIGQAALNQAQLQRNNTEGRQVQSFGIQKDAQQLFKSRTFEDLARSNDLAQQSTTAGTTQNNFNLANYIKEYGADEGNYGYYTGAQQQAIEQSRQGAVLSAQKQNLSNNFNNYIASLHGVNSNSIQATRSAYGL